ncbi:MAG: UDP-N-acetylmuramoyl-tripeptide--D-alanyl-D-alanine ligase [Pedobacter sp.]|nr:UDP-N-acetylmuramoyl-tripeptide--D-alanyl-D-alanine ligase [Pedobacter sp.]MDQ8052605.1 UDP-N-acetylmuramoyl-tripeptide--D-alanyl-D-alanine ligase [Pedobacter sp.]
MTHTEQLYQTYLKHPSISTDTRAITPDCLFFALKGANFDANAFALQAIEQGAAFAVVDDATLPDHAQLLQVADVLTALQELARYHRQQLTIPVIGLTGSNGKTTTKELIRAVLAEKFRTFATKGNLNNHIGVPLSILSLQNDTEIAVIEMGANHQKEIEFLCGIAQPTHGLITNVGMAHLDGFGGFEGVKKGKAELYGYLKAHAGFAFINRNNPYLLEMSAQAALNKVVYYGTEKENTISGTLKHSDPFIEFEWMNHGDVHRAKANLTGTYNFENILAAICIGHFFGLEAKEINNGLANYFPTNNRSQLTKTAHNDVICDFYNANPSSMSAALNNLKSLTALKKTAIMGDMFELGNASAEQHEKIVAQANQQQLDQMIFIGKHFYALKDKYLGQFYETPDAAAQFLQKNPVQGQLVLLKGSRGMALEQLLPYL